MTAFEVEPAWPDVVRRTAGLRRSYDEVPTAQKGRAAGSSRPPASNRAIQLQDSRPPRHSRCVPIPTGAGAGKNRKTVEIPFAVMFVPSADVEVHAVSEPGNRTEQCARHDPQRDVGDVVVRAAAIGETGRIARQNRQPLLIGRRRRSHADVQAQQLGEGIPARAAGRVLSWILEKDRHRSLRGVAGTGSPKARSAAPLRASASGRS
jgi:hypothetical protein